MAAVLIARVDAASRFDHTHVQETRRNLLQKPIKCVSGGAINRGEEAIRMLCLLYAFGNENNEDHGMIATRFAHFSDFFIFFLNSFLCLAMVIAITQ